MHQKDFELKLNIKNNYVDSVHAGSINKLGEHTVNISTKLK